MRKLLTTSLLSMETGRPHIATLDPTLVASPGGFPLMDGGKLIGAIKMVTSPVCGGSDHRFVPACRAALPQ
jgi:hypothetical protein